jgi:MFS family permease
MASVTSSTPAYITDLLEKENYGSAIGVLSTIMDIGQTIGPIISGYILVFFSYQGIFLMTGFTLLFAAFLFFVSFFLLKKKST